MPRGRTRARIRAVRIAAGEIDNDPERTPARLDYIRREIRRRLRKLREQEDTRAKAREADDAERRATERPSSPLPGSPDARPDPRRSGA